MEQSEDIRGASTTSTHGVAQDALDQQAPAQNGQASTQAEPDSQAPGAGVKISRTPGLKIFDVLLYPILTNVVVFGVSVAATYLTTKGGDRNAAGKLIYGKTGEFFQKRGEWLKNQFTTKFGMTENQADMSKMVAFSFIDGSIMAPVIKLFEDRRENIGRAIDIRLGTCPEDDSAYAAEPKQSWLSVLGGRLATVSIVVPTAVALDKTGLNDRLFTEPGRAFGKYMGSKPGVAKALGHLDAGELGRIGAFEAFYTSVCTAGIYVSSRLIAAFTTQKAEEKLQQQAQKATSDTTTPASAESASGAPQDSAGSDRSFVERVGGKSCPPVVSKSASGSFLKRLDAEPERVHALV